MPASLLNSLSELWNYCTERYDSLWRFVLYCFAWSVLLSALPLFYVGLATLANLSRWTGLGGLTPLSWVLIYLTLFLVIVLVVFQRVKYPVNPPDKIGLYFALSNRYDNQSSMDFLRKLELEIEKLLSQSRYGRLFNIYFLPEAQSQAVIKGITKYKGAYSVPSDNPFTRMVYSNLHIRYSNFTLLMYGDLSRGGDANDIEHYNLALDYQISHQSIPAELSALVSKQMKEILREGVWGERVTRDQIALLNFGQNIKRNSLFALGLSAYLSQQISITIEFHSELHQILLESAADQTQFKLMFTAVKDYLGRSYYLKGRESMVLGDNPNAIQYLQKSLQFKPNLYHSHLFLATGYYSTSPKFSDRRKEISYHLNKCQKINADASWKLSKGYIMAVELGDLRGGVKLYLDALRKGFIPEDIRLGTKKFLEERINSRPLNSLLAGYSNYYLSEKELAMHYFRIFLASDQNSLDVRMFGADAKKMLSRIELK